MAHPYPRTEALYMQDIVRLSANQPAQPGPGHDRFERKSSSQRNGSEYNTCNGRMARLTTRCETMLDRMPRLSRETAF